MSKSKLENEKNNISDLFLSEDETDKISFDGFDYLNYDDVEVAEVVIIPIEDNSEIKKKVDYFNFKFQLSAKDLTGLLNSLVTVLCTLGETTSSIIKSVVVSLFRIIKIPSLFIWQKVIKPIIDSTKHRAAHSSGKSKLHDYKKFREDVAKALKSIREKETLRERRKTFFRNIRISFTKHRKVWLHAVNTVFPIICLIGLCVVINHYGNLTYALKVNYNGTDIGYISDEATFIEAKDRAVKRLSTGSASNVEIATPTYSIAMLTPNKLSDSKTICDRIIENTEGNFVNACGIYLDGDFVCAVKNETDAINVFDKILKPYEEKAGADATVALVQEVKFVQGLYSDNENTIWDSDKLESEMNSSKSSAIYYTVKQGDTPISIARENNMTYADLLKLNPTLANGNIYVGHKVLLSAQVNNIRVKVMKTETRTVSIPYETETKESSTLYKGTSKTVQVGKNGEQQVTEIVTYIDGIKTYATTVSTTTTKYPVKEIVYKGTKEVIQSTRPGNGGYGGGSTIPGDPGASDSSFGSPLAASYYISSHYGGRTVSGRYNFHRGVDLCHSGGSAGIPVLSIANGTVVSAQNHPSWGYTVLIRHANGLQTRYAHMQAGSICVRVGQTVSKGQQIGRVGNTGHSLGNHLHLEITKNGNLVNPEPYLRH